MNSTLYITYNYFVQHLMMAQRALAFHGAVFENHSAQGAASLTVTAFVLTATFFLDDADRHHHNLNRMTN